MKITMIFWWKFRWLLYMMVTQFNVYYVKTSWPSSNASNIQLLGLFKDAENVFVSKELSVHSRAMFKAAMLLSRQYNITIEGQFIGWQTAQTGGKAIDALGESCQVVSTSNIAGIIGPTLSKETYTIAEFAEKIGIPVISYAATAGDLSDRNVYPNFYRTVSSDNTTASAIVKLFLRFNWTSCVIIYQNDAYGSGGAKVINEAFINNNLSVSEMIVFDIATLRIRGDLKNYLTNSVTRIVVLWAQPSYTSRILQNALDSDVLGPQFTWILSFSIPLNSFNQTYHQKLTGMLTVEPVIGTVVGAPTNQTLLNAAYSVWQQYEPESFPGSMNVSYYALFAFDAAWLLIQSLHKLCLTRINSSSSCLSFIGSPFCFARRLVQSDLLLKTVSTTEFLGVSGYIQYNINEADRINSSYYYAQNAQLSSNGVSFVPVLAYADTGDWKEYTGVHVIVWPGNSFKPPSDRAILNGANLRIGVIESTPFTVVRNIINGSGQNSTQLVGYVPDLIELLRMKMGFIPNIKLVPTNESYSGLIQAVANGDYDIVMGDVTVTAQRRELVDFSNAISDNSLRIIMRKTSDVHVDLLSFLKPFSRGLWLTLLVATVFAAILLCVLEKQENEALQNRSATSLGMLSLWFAIGTIMGYGADFHVRSAAGRLLSVGLYMLSLILVATYTANLASDLTISKSKNRISGLDDLKSGKIPFSRIGIRVNTAGEDYYLREISKGSRNFYPLKSRQDLYDSLLAGIIDVSFMDIGTAEYITNSIYCNLTLVGEEFNKGIFGIVEPKKWLYAQDLDVNILLLRESGELDDLRRKWFVTKNCPESIETSTAMGIESMGGLFFIFSMICVSSLMLFAWMKRHKIKNYLLN